MYFDISTRFALCLIAVAILFNIDSLAVAWFNAYPPAGASSIYWEKQGAGVEAYK